ncbi:MAG: hypothetical protein ACLRRT_13465 [Ruthenibacterium lactatiformans]
MAKRMVTAGLTINLSGKRCIGDPGNDFVSQSWEQVPTAKRISEWEFPSGEAASRAERTNPGGGGTLLRD